MSTAFLPPVPALRPALRQLGALPLEGGIEAAYRAEIDAADEPKAKLEEIEERLNRLRSPFRTAELRSGSTR